MGCKKPASKLWPQAAVVFTRETHSSARSLSHYTADIANIQQLFSYLYCVVLSPISHRRGHTPSEVYQWYAFTRGMTPKYTVQQSAQELSIGLFQIRDHFVLWPDKQDME